MKISALILALTATAAHADRMTLLPGDATCFAFISIVNSAGTYNSMETLETVHGPVSATYRTIGAHKAGDASTADKVAVVSVPSNVIPVPWELDVLDGDTGLICLREYLGG